MIDEKKEEEFANENISIISKMHDQCIKYRGMIIHYAVTVETGIEMCISNYFGGVNKSPELLALLGHKSNVVTFSNKQLLLSYIINDRFTEFKKSHPDLLKNIDFIIEKRNILAHRKMILTRNDVQNFDGESVKIQWIKTKNGKIQNDFLEIDLKFMKEFNDLCKKTEHDLSDLDGLIKEEIG